MRVSSVSAAGISGLAMSLVMVLACVGAVAPAPDGACSPALGNVYDVAWSPDARTLAVMTLSADMTQSTIYRASYPNLQLEPVIRGTFATVSAAIGGVAISDDGAFIWVASTGNGDAIVSATASAEPHVLLGGELGRVLTDVNWTQKGVIFGNARGSGEVLLIPPTRQDSPDELYLPKATLQSVWAGPSGVLALETDRGPGTQTVFSRVAAGTATTLNPPGRLVGGPSLSPDGQAFVYQDHDQNTVALIPVGGGAVKTLWQGGVTSADVSSAGVLAVATMEADQSRVCWKDVSTLL